MRAICAGIALTLAARASFAQATFSALQRNEFTTLLINDEKESGHETHNYCYRSCLRDRQRQRWMYAQR